jgi:hypothetical protein
LSTFSLQKIRTIVVLTVIATASSAYAASNWTIVTPLSVPRFYLTASVGPNERIYAIGGQILNGLSSVVEVHRPSTNRWVRGPELSSPRMTAAATGGDGQIYTIGGFVSGIRFSSSVLAFTLGNASARGTQLGHYQPTAFRNCVTTTPMKVSTWTCCTAPYR